MKKLFTLLLIFFSLFARGDYWIRKADFGGGKWQYCISFSIGNKGYISNCDFWEYDPQADTWTQKANFGGTCRVYATGFSILNKGYIGLGSVNYLTYFNDFWEYDASTNIWVQKADFPGAAREFAVGFSIGNKGYIGTGDQSHPHYTWYMNDFWEYDPSTDAWTRKADFGGSMRTAASGFSITNKGYIGLGFDGYSGVDDFWEYNVASNLWIQKANFGGGMRYAAAGFSIGNKGYIGTGDPLTNDFWEFDPSTNIWTQKANVGGIQRAAAAGFSIGNKGYIGTGQYAFYPYTKDTNDFWEYTPDSTTGIIELAINNYQLSISPNPFTDKISFTLHDGSDGLRSIRFYDVSGKLVEQATHFENIELKNAGSGIYFYTAYTVHGKIFRGKVVKE